MADTSLPEPPAQLKAIQSFMRIATEVDRVDAVVAYWIRLFCTETALKIDKDSPECKAFLGSLIVWLEKFKTSHKENEAVTNETVGQAHYENFVIALFNKADTLDREGTANKNTIRMFFMAAVLFEAMAVFGPLTDDINKRAKYAKFKAAYIQKCLKTGQTPKPGPLEGDDLNTDGTAASGGVSDIPEVPTNNPLEPEKPHSNAPDPYIMTPGAPQPYKPGAPSTTTYNNDSVSQTKPNPPPESQPAASGTKSVYDMSQTVDNKLPGASSIQATRFHATNGTPLNAEDLIKSQKYCKFANSALQYDDIPTAVANLEKALRLLTTGQRPD